MEQLPPSPVKEPVHCPICLESFNGLRIPRQLICQHSFCGNCIKKLLEQSLLEECPVCRRRLEKIQSVNDVPVTQHLIELIGIMSSPVIEDDGLPKKCDECDEEVHAVSKCVECKENYCGFHVEAHLRSKKTNKHQLEAFKLPEVNMCKTHKEVLECICKRKGCEKLLCHKCLPEDGHNHYQKITEWVNENKPLFQGYEEFVKNYMKELEDFLKTEKDLEAQFAQRKQVVLERIMTFFYYMEAYIFRLRDESIAELEDICIKQEHLLKKQINSYREELSLATEVDVLLKRFHREHVQMIHGAAPMARQLQMWKDAGIVGLLPPDVSTKIRIDWKQLEKLVKDSIRTTTREKDSRGGSVSSYGSRGGSVSMARSASLVNPNAVPSEALFAEPWKDFAHAYSLGTQGTSAGQFDTPYGVCADKSDNIYVADSNNNRIQVIRPNGQFVRKFGETGFGHLEFNIPVGVAVDPTSKLLFVADMDNHRIQIFNPDGSYHGVLGSNGKRQGQFGKPSGIAIDAYGNLVVSEIENNRIQIVKPNGTFVHMFGSFGAGDGELNGPHDVAVDRTGNIIVADFNNSRIQIFDSKGKFLSKIAKVTQPTGITLDQSGRIFVCEHSRNVVEVFSSSGAPIATIGSGKLRGPLRLSMSPSGMLLVTDASSVHVFTVKQALHVSDQ